MNISLVSPQAEDLASAVLTTEQDSILDLSLGFVPALPDESPPAPSPPAPPPAAGAEADFSTSCGNGVCEDYESCGSCAQDCRRPNGNPCQRVGILYSVWHWYAAPHAHTGISAHYEVCRKRHVAQHCATTEWTIYAFTMPVPYHILLYRTCGNTQALRCNASGRLGTRCG